LEGTYNDHLFQLPDHFRADQKLKYGFKGIILALHNALDVFDYQNAMRLTDVGVVIQST